MKLLEGDVFIDQFKESKLAEPRVLNMIERIRINHEPEFDAGGASTRHKVRVEAKFKDGQTLVEDVEQRKGSAHFPLTKQDIERKFRGLANAVLVPAAAEKIIEHVQNIDSLYSMETLTSILRNG